MKNVDINVEMVIYNIYFECQKCSKTNLLDWKQFLNIEKTESDLNFIKCRFCQTEMKIDRTITKKNSIKQLTHELELRGVQMLRTI